MQGFKSFANRITIPFPGGYNVICGPNGSGKSNIIDALLFVLGTTSARSIRAMKLQNLLFNGARDKKSADFCEVSIYLDNTDNKIPGDEKEVKITRRDAMIGDGKVRELQKQKVATTEVDSGEFGTMIIANIEIAPGDYLESFIITEK